MNVSDLFYGPAGHIYAATSNIIVLFTILLVSLKLYFSRRKKGYLSLTLGIITYIVQYLLIISIEFGDANYYHSTLNSVQFFKILAFILINMGIYQLYNPTRTREYIYFYSSISVTFIIFLITWFHYSQTSSPTEQIILWYNIWYELYLFVLMFLCYFTVTPFIGQRGKYQLSLAAYFIIQTAHISNLYITAQLNPLLTIVEDFGPILYSAILFQILFQRIVEMLHVISNSSITDGLTGLYNRKFFYTRVTQYIAMNKKPAVIFCDIDNFKKLNDTKGHQKGDEVLRQVAAIMREESEEIGIAGRYGGEELVVVLSNSAYNVEDIAEKIRKRVEMESGSTVSIGYSRMKPGLSAEQLIKQADHAMYSSKKSGKNRVTGYAPNLAV